MSKLNTSPKPEAARSCHSAVNATGEKSGVQFHVGDVSMSADTGDSIYDSDTVSPYNFASCGDVYLQNSNIGSENIVKAN